MENINQIWNIILQNYSSDMALHETLWNDLVNAYTHESRHYHNIDHITHMIGLASTYKSHIEHPNALFLAIFYHDIVYDVKRHDNELKSWEFAKKHLKGLQLPKTDLNLIEAYILATKDHQDQSNNDTKYMLDFDLQTLGKSWNDYKIYTEQIREEYSIYPDRLYIPGRIQVLTHFLKTDCIYKTPTFYTLYEDNAQSNLKQELELLKNQL